MRFPLDFKQLLGSDACGIGLVGSEYMNPRMWDHVVKHNSKTMARFPIVAHTLLLMNASFTKQRSAECCLSVWYFFRDMILSFALHGMI
jgi:hypothetical protein